MSADPDARARQAAAEAAAALVEPGMTIGLGSGRAVWAVVDILKPFVAEVGVSNPLKTKAIAEAKIKTDKVDAEVLAQLLRCDFLPRVWEPPVAT